MEESGIERTAHGLAWLTVIAFCLFFAIAIVRHLSQ
jgi:hypothetical protein